MVNVGYIIASFIAIFITTLLVYKVANKLFGLGLRLKPILLCAVCAMLISLVLPKIIVGFAGLPATLGVLAIFAVVFAYFIARSEDTPLPNQKTDADEDNAYCLVDTLAQPEVLGNVVIQPESVYQSANESDCNEISNGATALSNMAVGSGDTDNSEYLPESQTILHRDTDELKLETLPIEDMVSARDQETGILLETKVDEQELMDAVPVVEADMKSDIAELASDDLPAESANAVEGVIVEQPTPEELADAVPIVEADMESDIAELANDDLFAEITDTIESVLVEQQLMDSQESLEDNQLEAEGDNENQEPSAILATEVEAVEKEIMEEQQTAEEEAASVIQTIDADIESDIAEVANVILTADTTDILEDKIVEQQLMDSQENLEDNLNQSETEGDNEENQEPSAILATEVEAVEKEIMEEQQTAEEEAASVVQAVDADIESDIAELANVILTADTTDILEDKMVEQQLMDSQEKLVDNHNQLEIEADYEMSTPGLEFQQAIPREVSSIGEDEIKDFAEPGQITAEVLPRMTEESIGEEIIIQDKLPGEPSFVQEADELMMECTELNVDPVQIDSESLDDLIDLAFMSKENQDYNNAFKTFKKALALYPNSEAAPFLVVEIGNILKKMGNYDEAIKVFSDGRNLSKTKQDEMMEQEFISTIAYLRITKNILLQNRLGSIPFLEIPPQILDQIEEEFREWRSVGNI